MRQLLKGDVFPTDVYLKHRTQSLTLNRENIFFWTLTSFIESLRRKYLCYKIDIYFVFFTLFLFSLLLTNTVKSLSFVYVNINIGFSCLLLELIGRVKCHYS